MSEVNSSSFSSNAILSSLIWNSRCSFWDLASDEDSDSISISLSFDSQIPISL